MALKLKFAPILTPDNISTSPRKRTIVLNSKVPISHLLLSDQQRTRIVETYKNSNNPSITDASFDNTNQGEAHRLLLAHKLDHESLDQPANKWCAQWSTSSPKEKYKHILLQCCCGCDHQLRKSSSRRAPYDFTGCLAHVEIITVQATGYIVRVHGMLEHHLKCREANLMRIPVLDLHPNVREVALQQLINGASLTELQEKNRMMVAARQYRDQAESLGKFRYLLRPYDTGSLYTQYFRAQGIDIKEKPHINIHNWLNPKSKTYNPTLARAIFHYSARTTENTRFEICISTDEMKEAAWRYGHLQQILVDGTFGVCDRRILLFIIMGIDEQNHGVPFAFLLFSAPGGNKATQGGYDTSILIKVISRWKDSLTLYRQQQFAPAVAITDTDFKERGALLEVFPGINLLICRFHLRQSWSNHRGKSMRGYTPGLKEVRNRLIVLERQLVDSTNFDNARSLIAEETNALNRIAVNGLYASAAGKGLAHLEYLRSYWMTEALWASWSDYGRQAAAAKIGIAVQGVVMTNNTLESFNGLLKHKMLKGWSRGGRRIRVDTLVFMLSLKVAQSIFLRRRLEEDERNMLRKALEGVPGVDALIGKGQAAHKPIEAPVAYLSPDTRRDNEARLLIQQNRLSRPLVNEKGIQLTCWSTQSVDSRGTPTAYTIGLGFDGVAFCTCADFQQRGGACKHMRAALYQVHGLKLWAQRHRINDPIAYAPNIELPPDKATAIRAIATQYGTGVQNPVYAHEGAICPDSGPEEAGNVVAQAARCVNEALHGGFLGDIDNTDEFNEKGKGGTDGDDYETEDMSSGEATLSWSSGDESDIPSHLRSSSARGVSEQVIARTSYDLKRLLKLIETIDPSLNHITRRDLQASVHHPAYTQCANKLEAFTARICSLSLSDPLAIPSRSNTWVPAPLQHNTLTVPLPPSPEQRQYRKNSRSFH